MKLVHLHAAARAATERQRLIDLRDRAVVAVSLNGRYMDAEMTEAVRPIVAAELNRHIAEVEADLRSYGVEVPGASA